MQQVMRTNIKFANTSDSALKFFKFSMFWSATCSVLIFLVITLGVTSSEIFALKDGVIYLLSLLYISRLVKNWSGVFSVFLLSLFTLCLFINYALLNPSYIAVMNNIRQILGPLIVLLIYCQIKLDMSSSFRALKFLCWTIIAVFGLGIIEQIFGLWTKLNLTTFFTLKGIPTDADGLSYMFYEPLFGGRVRMTSTFIDPISLGHFFASSGTLLFFTKNKNRLANIAFYCCLAGLCLALSKGALLQLFISIFLLNKRIHLLIRLALSSIPILILLFVNSAGIALHITSFLNAINTMTLFGYGIGNAGNYALMFGAGNGISRELMIGDTYLGALIGQIGIIGTIAFVGIAVSIIIRASESIKHIETALIIFISILTVSAVSENTMNITSFLLPAIIIGLSIQLSKYADDVKNLKNGFMVEPNSRFVNEPTFKI
jgi:hypothetical protein